MNMEWSAQQYVKFEGERTRPVRDLIAQIPAGAARRAIDLGCGPGNSTALLQLRFPEARVTGLDDDAVMIAAARARLPQTRFEQADIAAWSQSGATVDIILANAALQWVPDHATLLPALLERLEAGGSLAVQMPDNLDEPAHHQMRAVAAHTRWADRLGAAARPREGQHDAAFYHDLLSENGATVDLWRTIYQHPLPDLAAVIEWFRGSALRPFLAPLDAAERSDFLALYAAAIAPYYPPRRNGSILLPFPRLFFVATLPAA